MLPEDIPGCQLVYLVQRDFRPGRFCQAWRWEYRRPWEQGLEDLSPLEVEKAQYSVGLGWALRPRRSPCMVVATPAAALVANPAAAGSRPILVAPGRIGLYPLHADGSCKHFSMWSSWRVRGWPLQRHSVSRERDKTRFVKAVHELLGEGDLLLDHTN